MRSPESFLATPRGQAGTSDPALIAGVVRHDEKAFEELYRRHSGHALMLARKLCPSGELAEEIVQESFISLWRSASRYRPSLGSVSVWLSSIVRNRAIDAWRRAAVRPSEVPIVTEGPGQLLSAIGGDTPPPERAVVLALIAELPAPQKEAVFLAYFGDMTHEEIARWSGAPLGTIKGRIRMGMQKIRAGLEEQTIAADEALAQALHPPSERPAEPDLERAAEPVAVRASEPVLVHASGRAATDEPDVAELDAARRRRAALAPEERLAVGCGRPAA
jgi:RNA polymerase sigma-70 factor, ECF subfamily